MITHVYILIIGAKIQKKSKTLANSEKKRIFAGKIYTLWIGTTNF